MLFGLYYAVSCALVVLMLTTALRWPLVRGKHVLCLSLGVELAGRVVGFGIFVLGATGGWGGIEAAWSLSVLSQLAAAGLLLAFLNVMGEELRERSA